MGKREGDKKGRKDGKPARSGHAPNFSLACLFAGSLALSSTWNSWVSVLLFLEKLLRFVEGSAEGADGMQQKCTGVWKVC